MPQHNHHTGYTDMSTLPMQHNTPFGQMPTGQTPFYASSHASASTSSLASQLSDHSSYSSSFEPQRDASFNAGSSSRTGPGPPPLPKASLAQTAARSLLATTCSDDILQEKQELLRNPPSTVKRAATNALDLKQDAISRCLHVVDVAHAVNSAPTHLDPVIPTFERQGTPAPCQVWTLRCTR